MSKVKIDSVDLSVPLSRLRICKPFDAVVRGNICLSPSVRSFYVMRKLERFEVIVPVPLPTGCMWSKCVCECITCSRCEYNLYVL